MKILLNNRIYKCIFILILTVTALASFLLLINSAEKVSSDEIQVETELQNKYALNEIEIFSQEIEVSYEGKTYIAKNPTLVLPNGNKISISNESVSFDTVGKYTISYYFTADNGKVVCASDEFFVVQKKYEFMNGGSSSITMAESTTEICKNNDDEKTYTGDKGAIVRLNSGSKFVYNKPIDLSKGDYGSLRSVIKLDPRPYNISYNEEEGKYDYNYTITEQIVIRLTDCYDSLNYVELLIDGTKQPGTGTIYLRATHSNESTNHYSVRAYPTSEPLAWWGDKEFYMDGERGIVFYEYGVYYPVNGLSLSKDSLEFLYDSDRDRIYVRSGTAVLFILDVANEFLYGDKAFKGFKTDEVILSIEGVSYKAAEPLRFDIFTIDGKAINSNEDIDYIDEVPPKIDVQIEKTDKKGVFIAKGESFVIPQATVSDFNYCGDLSVKVYRNYLKSNQINVSVKNGTFLVGEIGTYTIVYTAVDSFGNKTDEILEVRGVPTTESISISAKKLEKLYLGETVTIPEYTISTINKQDSVKVTIKAITDDDVVEVDPKDMQLYIRKTETYKIVYTVQDNVCVKEFSYNVDVEIRNDAVFIDKPFIPEYVIKGASYKVEQIFAYVKDGNNFENKKADLMVAFDGGAFEKVTDINKLIINGNESVSIKFIYDKVESQIITSKIVDVGFETADNLQLDKYFIGDFTAGTIFSDGQETGSITYTSNINSGSNSLRFINQVNYRLFKLALNVPEGKDDFSKINIRFINPKNQKQTMTLTIEKTAENAVVCFENSLKKAISVPFSGTSNIDASFEYDRRRIVVNGTKLDFYNTFDYDYAYLEIELVGIEGESAISINEVGNVPFNRYITVDTYNPEAWINKALGRYNPGDEIVIYSPIYSDVLSLIDYSTAKISVRNENNEFVKTIDGVLLDGTQKYEKKYVIKPSEYGTYVVQYEVCDGKGISAGKNQYRFSVADNVAPEIDFKGKDEKTIVKIGVNEAFKLNYEIVDNCDSKEKLYVQVNVLDHSDQSLSRNVGNNFSISKQGFYTVYVYCLDSSGNSAFRYFYMEVK